MRKLNTGNWKQKIFYTFIFLITLIVPEPTPIFENFWSKADFYDSIPFTVYYLQYKIIYAAVFSLLVWGFVKFSRKHL
jgi:hypothetical protein